MTVYYSLSRNVQQEIEWKIRDKCVLLPGRVKSEVVLRVAHLALAVSSVALAAADVVIGSAAMVANVATLGLIKPVASTAFCHLSSMGQMVARPYLNLLRMINPKASAEQDRIPFVTDCIAYPILKMTEECVTSNKFFHKYVTSRLTFALEVTVRAVTSAIDGIIGLGATALSLITLGKYDAINIVAFIGLCTLGNLVPDMIMGTVKVINPWAGS